MTFTLPTTRQDEVSQLLGCTVEQLDLTPTEAGDAKDRYDHVADHLALEGGDIYVQGSFMLGTVVRPHLRHGEFDLDLVCLTDIAKTSITQAELKARVGVYLDDYVKNAGDVDGETPELVESRRCWTLQWDRFHMDVLPAIRNAEVESPTAILLTDKNLRLWQQSDPLAYVEWFRGQCEQQFVYERQVMAKSATGSVDDVPKWRVRTTLHRAVQVLKRHRDLHFANKPADLRPPSSLLTTLAGLSFGGQAGLLEATMAVISRAPEHIERRNGTYWVANPVCDENFADKWNEYPERRTAFFGWCSQVERDLEAALTGTGTLYEDLKKAFGEEPVRQAGVVIGARTRDASERGALRVTRSGGALTTGVGIPVVKHRFYGGSPTT